MTQKGIEIRVVPHVYLNAGDAALVERGRDEKTGAFFCEGGRRPPSAAGRRY